jgi:hypothetical protein
MQIKHMNNGRVLADSKTEAVNVKTGFFAKLKVFFRVLFGRLPKVVQEYFNIVIIERFYHKHIIAPRHPRSLLG